MTEALPRIYVASLSDYNAGRLHGRWVEAAQKPEDLQADIDAMLGQSSEPAEEWAIHDYEGFGAMRLGEYESLALISRVARGIVEHGLAYGAWADLSDRDGARLDQFEEAYRGRWQSVEAYAEELLDDLGATEASEQVPDWLQSYLRLDVAGFARDLRLSGAIHVVEAGGGVDVFDGTI